jgi:hypothetical protein
VSIDSTGASNTPQPVPVTLTVNPAGGGADTSTAQGGVTAILGAEEALGKTCYALSSTQQGLDQTQYAAVAAAIQSEVDAGRVSYTRSQADACLAWMTSLTCAQFEYYIVGNNGGLNSNASCATALTGLVSNGAACTDDVDCPNGYCALGATCPSGGTCTAFKASGAACQSDSECGTGKVCDWNGAGYVCLTPSPASAGQPCTYGHPYCALGLYCDYAQSTPTCTAKLAAGATCTGSAQGECAAGLACAADLKCRPYVGAGASCSVQVCGNGFYCSSSTSRCVAMPVAGGDCTDPNATSGGSPPQCLDGSYCLGTTTRTCESGTVAAGGTCNPAGTTPSVLCAPPPYGESVSCMSGKCTVTDLWSCL